MPIQIEESETMLPRRIHIFALAFLLIASVVTRADKIDDYVKAEMERQHVPGVSIVVIKDMKIIKMAGYGFANVELNVPAKPETVYKIGSVSKQFIATGIMMLVQEGRITLDDPVSKFLDGTPDTWKAITVRHLLTHTSGIVREAPGFDPLKIQNDADVIKTAYSLPLHFSPGDKYEYCNVGYFSLAEIIRKVTGKSWADYLNESIFARLQMNATRTTNVTDLVLNRASGYVWTNSKLQNADIYFALRPSGAFLSTVVDLAKWDAALYSDKVLKQSTLAQMWTPAKLNNGTTTNYGFGWLVDTVGRHKEIHHGGSLPGFRSEIARFVDDKLTVVVLTNGDNAVAGLFALNVANFYIQGLLPRHVVAKINPKILDAYVGQYQPPLITITREGDKLMMQTSENEEKAQLLPESATDFFTRETSRTTYSFIKDDTGATYFVVKFEGRETGRAKKIK
jgi:CubicO group peptidase (beta-lactamase class C family)